MPALFCLVPIVLVVSYVHLRGRNVPFWDEWESSAELAIRTSDTGVPWAMLGRQHNEHRLLFSNLATVVFTKTTQWNLKGEMYLSIVLTLAVFLLLVSVLARDCPRAVPVALVPLSALLFSVRQSFNWIMGLQTNMRFLVFFTVAALWVLRRHAPGWRPLAGAAALAACANFTQGAGLLVWPTLFLVLWPMGYRRWSFTVFWVAAAAVSVRAFFTGFGVGPPAAVLPLRWLEYAVTFAGNPFFLEIPGVTGRSRAVAIAGLLLFACDIAVLRRCGHRWRSLATWIALALFTWETAFMAAPYRCAFGLRQAMTARYVTQATVFWLGLVAVGSMVVMHARHGRRTWQRAAAALNAGFGCLLLLLYLFTNWASWRVAIVSDAQTECLRRYPETHDASCLRSLHPVFEPDAPNDAMKEAILRRIDALHAHRLTVFAADPPRRQLP